METKKLKVLALLTEDSAVGFYRIWQPLKILERLGMIELKITPTFTWGKDKNEVKKFPELKWFSTDLDNKDRFRPDIIVAERHDHLNYIALIGGVAKAFDVPLVVDTDDDVQNVRPFNPGYVHYNPEASNLIYNIKLLSLPNLSAITVSTPGLKDALAKFNKPTYVVPNAIDTKTRVLSNNNLKKKKIRIGWLGSACHWENLQIIRQAVADIIANYPNVEFIFTNLHQDIWADPPKEVIKRMLPVCKFNGCKEKYHSYCTKAYIYLDKYPKFLNKLNIDIGLAPLCDNAFNRSKSNLRILEYWADKIAVIASPVRPYKETIIDGVNGLLAKERIDWYNAIEKLILDEKLRTKLKENGFKSLCQEWNAEKVAKDLFKTYKKIIKDHERRGVSKI